MRRALEKKVKETSHGIHSFRSPYDAGALSIHVRNAKSESSKQACGPRGRHREDPVPPKLRSRASHLLLDLSSSTNHSKVV